jgi:hypothetical protein
MPRRRSNPHRIFQQIKFYAVEVGGTILFVVWVAKEVWHQLGR